MKKRNLENGDSDSDPHPDGHRHLARRNELHVGYCRSTLLYI